MDRANHVLNVDPAHPLPTVSNLSADAHLEGRQHFAQRSTVRGQNDPGTHLDGADARMGCGLRRGLPLAANVGEKSSTGLAFLVQNFVATVTVVADRRTADEHFRLVFGSCQSFRQGGGSRDPAVADFCFLGFRPASDNAFTREMNDCAESGNHLRRNRLRRIPRNLIVACSCPPHQARNAISAGSERRKKGGPDWPGNTTDEDSRDHGAQVVTLSACAPRSKPRPVRPIQNG